jgi:hypothetical protein
MSRPKRERSALTDDSAKAVTARIVSEAAAALDREAAAIAKNLGSDRSASSSPPSPPPKPEPDEELSPQLARERKRIRDRRPNRATYDIPPDLRQKIAKLSVKYGCPQSQLATLMLIHALKAIEVKDIDPTALQIPSDSPKFAHNLDLTIALTELKKLL